MRSPTYFEDTLQEARLSKKALEKKESADVCVIGAGLAGLNVALSLVELNKNVVVLEEHRVGDSASGRNAGMVCSGFQREPLEIMQLIGYEKAKTLWSWASEARDLILYRVHKLKINCGIEKSGQLTLSCYPGVITSNLVSLINRNFGTSFKFWTKEEVRAIYKSTFYHSGLYDPDSFSLHPLNYVLGLARACESEGARIYEESKAIEIRQNSQPGRPWVVCTPHSSVECDYVVLTKSFSVDFSCNTKFERSLASCYTYIMVTEPLGKRIREICGPHPVCDDRLSLSYYRILPDSRLLWGGLACAFPIKSTQKQIKLLRQDMLQAYPQLEDIKIDYVWGGKLAFGWDLMPLIQEKNGIWQVSGFGGHGLIPTTLCGSLVACAISSNYADTRWKILSESFQPKYTGWPFTTFWTFLYLKAFQLRDYFVFKFQKRD